MGQLKHAADADTINVIAVNGIDLAEDAAAPGVRMAGTGPGFCSLANTRLLFHIQMMRRFSVALLMLSLSAAAEPRVPWTTSRVHGSPDPPKPYASEAVFTQLTFSEGLEMNAAGGRLFIVEKAGKIWSFEDQPEPATRDLLIDLKALHPDLDHAYGIAFHPKWRDNGQVFLTFAVTPGLEDGTKVARFRLLDGQPPRLDPASEEVLLTWRSGGHNGASIQFGPDGMLYISTGDSEVPSPPDPLNTGQDSSDLLGSILRIDVDRQDSGKRYAVPADNPFVAKPHVRPEIWAFGFRNPWKIAFDRQARLWCGDVGWELWEMVHLVKRGGNHGWSAMEASQPVKMETLSSLAPITPPVVAHPHTEAASITGGYVYYGNRLPELHGAYLYGDYETGKIWALWHDGQKITRHDEIADTAHRIVTFGQGGDGEIYYLHWGNPSSIHRLVPNPQAAQPATFPRLLSETGLFDDTAKQQPANGVYEFTIAEPMWHDGAQARRFVALPGNSSVQTLINRRKDGGIASSKVAWPKDAVLVKTLDVPDTARGRIETQLLHFDGENWNGYSYRWNAGNTDAELAGTNGGEHVVAGVSHRIHSRAECARCHTPWAGFALGFQPQQLAGIGNGQADKSAVALGLVDADFFDSSPARLVNSQDHRADIESRARSWLHSNCAHCHRQHGGGSVAIKVNAELPLAETMLVGEKPLRGEFGISDARLVAPGAPWRSVLVNRIARTGSGHMPLIGAQNVDEQGLRLLWDWVETLAMRSPPPTEPHPQSAASRLADGAVASKLAAMTEDPSWIGDAAKVNQTIAGDAATAFRVFHAADREPNHAHRDHLLKTLAKSPDANIAGLFERFLPPAERPVTLGTQVDAPKLLAMQGQAQKGAELLSANGKMAICLACHFVKGTGRDFGPDLSTVGSRLTPEQILESLLSPSKIITPGFAAHQVELTDGSAQTGFLAGQTESAIVLKLPTGQPLTLPRSRLQLLKPLPASLMPENLLQSLTPQEAADLLAYLSSLR